MTLTYVDLGLEGTLAIPTFHLGGATGRDGKGRAQGGGSCPPCLPLSPLAPPVPITYSP